MHAQNPIYSHACMWRVTERTCAASHSSKLSLQLCFVWKDAEGSDNHNVMYYTTSTSDHRSSLFASFTLVPTSLSTHAWTYRIIKHAFTAVICFPLEPQGVLQWCIMWRAQYQGRECWCGKWIASFKAQRRSNVILKLIDNACNAGEGGMEGGKC